MSRRSLPHARRSFLARMSGLRGIAQTLSLPTTSEDRRLSFWVAIESANCWASFLRRYYILSATGARDRGGVRISSNQDLKSEEEAITFAVNILRPRRASAGPPWVARDEPDWLDPGNVSRLLNSLSCSNSAGFNAAVSLGTSARQDLLSYRNFVAHRNRLTALKVRAVAARSSVYQDLDPVDLPLQRTRRSANTLLVDWIGELETMISLSPE